jgi:hypothetical protein
MSKTRNTRMNQMLSPELSERVRRLSDESLVLVLEAFREGRKAATTTVTGQLGGFCNVLLGELEQHHDSLTPEQVEQLEANYDGARPSPVVTAHFGGAADMVERMKGELRRLGWREHS